MSLLNLHPGASSFPRTALLFLVLFFIALAAGLVSLASGSVFIPVSEILTILLQDSEQVNAGYVNARIVLEIRFPRIISGFIVGGMLALAGALMQVLLRNPLAEPYILGISGGSAVFALLAIIAGAAGLWVNLSACSGALITMFMVFVLSGSASGWNPLKVLLTGVVIAAGWGAVISLILAVSPSMMVHGMLFWLMGDLSFSQYHTGYPAILIIALVLAMMFARALNLLSTGDLQAASLGVSVERLRIHIYFLASILTATAVMQAGSIGFIGLIIPHGVRLLIGSDHRVVLPVSVLSGGTLLVLADTFSRTVLAPQQLPVGVLTAIIGVPVFLLLLQSTSAGQKP